MQEAHNIDTEVAAVTEEELAEVTPAETQAKFPVSAAIAVREFSNGYWGFRSIVTADGRVGASGWRKGYPSRERAIEEARKLYGDREELIPVVTL